MIGRVFGRRRDERGQGLVEFSLVLPIFLLLLLIMLEFGLAFNQNLTLGLATREGARAGAALSYGTATTCPVIVDQQIIAGMQRVLKSPGSDVKMANITQIRIFKATVDGKEDSGKVNVWVPTVPPGSGADVDPGFTADKLDFMPQTVNWGACTRDQGAAVESIGVAIRYDYKLKTPLGSLMAFLHGLVSDPIKMTDQTVMVLEPLNP